MSKRLFPAIRDVMIAHALVFIFATLSAAQPLRPPAEDAAPPASTPQAAREPGYLGLIADDRREQGAGVRVVRVMENSPAAKAGFQVNDLITSIEGQAVGSLAAMAAQLEPHTAEDKVRFEVRRGDAAQTLEVVLGARPALDERPFQFGRIPERLPEPSGSAPPIGAAPDSALPSSPVPAASAGSRGQLLGIRSGPVTEQTRNRLGVPQAGGALVVARVVGSPADRAGIPLDAVIVALNGRPVGSPTDLARLVSAAGAGREVEIDYYIGNERRKATVTLANVPDAARPASPAPGPDPFSATRPLEPDPPEAQTPQARIELLEGRIRELEQRVQELERALRALQPEPPSRQQP